MLVEIIDYSPICTDDLANRLRMGLVWKPCRGRGYYALGLKLVRVEQVADEGLRVIRFIEDVG